MNTFDENRFRWKGINPRVSKAMLFTWSIRVIDGANFKHFMWLGGMITISMPYKNYFIWQEGWNACFRQHMDDAIAKDSILDSTKVYKRKN